MEKIDPIAFEYVLSGIKDGNIFERFIQDLLCQILGQEFRPMGGFKDKGIDGLEHCIFPKNIEKTIYQISIDSDPKTKIFNSVKKLIDNKIEFKRFFYVTNRSVKEQDVLEEAVYEKYKAISKIRDSAWLRGNINNSSGTIRTYLSFLENYCHEFSKPGKSYELIDFDTDPRIYVFLRQQWEEYGNKVKLDEMLVDSLIIFSLEGTDPDKGLFLGRDDIIEKIKSLINFSPNLIETLIDKRLIILSTKPRKINFHSDIDKYCLPYNTRLKLEEKNLEDYAIYESFFVSVKIKLKRRLKSVGVKVKDIQIILKKILNNLFKQQGLEFSDFVMKRENKNVIEKSLPDIISQTVDISSVIPRNRPAVKSALLGVMRDIIYNGTIEEKEYLRRLSKSYMALFLLQCDPKVAMYFGSMAENSTIFVCNSILVPALSEFPMEQRHRRHWNLLVNASKAGIRLIVTREIVKELCAHVKRSIQIYDEQYKGLEETYKDEIAIRYIDEILIRAYFYSLNRGESHSFYEFIDNFVTPSSSNFEQEMIDWLKYTFKIDFLEESVLNVTVDKSDLDKLTKELSYYKHSVNQARTDSKTILNVCALREKQNEAGDSGVFGYKTWWLSKDTNTQKSVDRCFGDKYYTSCYIRPDFLYNYISLAPNIDDANKVFDSLFPTLAGVTISHHIPPEVCNLVNHAIREHSKKEPARIRAIIRKLTDKLKTELGVKNIQELKHYLDEELSKI